MKLPFSGSPQQRVGNPDFDSIDIYGKGPFIITRTLSEDEINCFFTSNWMSSLCHSSKSVLIRLLSMNPIKSSWVGCNIYPILKSNHYPIP
ncbi:hypothetical protein [Membranihabitans maritimus]|uniref:hypothetical protein n=1 Tax=Membranihabitans maritimus TaxID=2904244 RepID=UPI001F1EB3E5|nr:hypothetical protein [Membranihabitans maritimus]